MIGNGETGRPNVNDLGIEFNIMNLSKIDSEAGVSALGISFVDISCTSGADASLCNLRYQMYSTPPTTIPTITNDPAVLPGMIAT
jgi:hypothetical protein